MYPDIIDATYLQDYQIRLYFENGESGIVDFKKYINKKGIFTKIKDIEKFRQFKINKELGVISWFDTIDIAPETLYQDAICQASKVTDKT